jgi:hypothetical protein
MRKCEEKGCERSAAPGWTRCTAHAEVWLDRLFHIPMRWPASEPKPAA